MGVYYTRNLIASAAAADKHPSSSRLDCTLQSLVMLRDSGAFRNVARLLTLVIPASPPQVDGGESRRPFRRIVDRRREALVSGFRLSPERHTGRHLSGIR